MKKLINALLALALALQLAVPMSAMAEGEETTTSSYSLDFSTTVSLKRDQAKDSMGHQYFKGQYGKGKDDTSVRVYTLGEERAYSNLYQLTHTFPAAVQGDTTNNIGHASYEYLQEDANSGHQVRLIGQTSDGTEIKSYLINLDRRYPTQPYLCNSSTGAYKTGTWAKVDVYFQTGVKGVTIFHNGTKYVDNNVDFSTFAKMTGVELRHSHFTETEVATPIATAVQFDNLKFEYVSAIPDAQDYRYLGEMFNFDDGFTHDIDISSKDGNYKSKYVIENGASALVRVPWTGMPLVRFNGTGSDVTFVKGIAGQPAWNTSAYYVGTGSNSIDYVPGIKDLKSGDLGHLTFKINLVDCPWRTTAINGNSANGGILGMTFGGTTESTARTIFALADPNGDNNKYFSFFGTNTSKVADKGQWHKIDIVFEIGNGTNTYTTADCYANGELLAENVEIKAADNSYAILNHIGKIVLAQGGNERKIYIDDFGFGVFTEDTLHDPTEGYTLTSNDEAFNTCIDNTNRIILMSEGYTVANFMSKINEKDNVTVYNADGQIVTTGTMDGCSVKVSNGFGGGVWYTLADSAVIKEDNFNNGIPNSKVTNLFDLYYYSPVATGGLGGKAADDLALELDRTQTSNTTLVNTSDWKSQTVILEGSFLLKNEESSAQFMMIPNDLDAGNLQYLLQFNSEGAMRTMYRNVLEEKWQPNRWYKIAAVMDYGSKVLKVYLNGDIIWDGAYTTLSGDGENMFGESGAGFTHLSQIRIVYDGQIAMDNIRVSYGSYDPSKDKIEISSSDVAVNNEKSIIGFDGGCDGFTSEDLVGYFEDVDMTVYANNDMTTEAEDLDEDSVAVVSKGEVLKYYEMGYKTKKLQRPEITYADNALTATAVLEDTALKTEDSTAVLFLAVYGENGLETVISNPTSSVKGLTADLTASIPSIEMLNKTAKAFLWDTKTSMVPLYNAKDFELETSEE